MERLGASALVEAAGSGNQRERERDEKRRYDKIILYYRRIKI